MRSFHAVIMAGGSGTRFWPASRTDRPKQFLPLADGQPLVRATVERVRGIEGLAAIWIVTNPRQEPALRVTLPDFPADRIIVEPEARDTAPCVALAAARIEAVDPGALQAVMPADHLIEPVDAFHGLLRRGVELAADGETLVTFGIRPTRPATGYGYIEPGARLDDREPPAWRVSRFREKPNLATAKRFLEDGRALWNSGIFVWSTSSILAAMDVGAPELAACARAMLHAAARGDRAELDASFRRAPRTSVDFAVMERAPKVAVVDADIRWDDLGSFLALGSVSAPDAAGNIHIMANGARVAEVDSKDCVVYGDGPRMIAMIGTRDLVVVNVDDAILVCPKHRADDLKNLIERLREQGQTDLL